MHEQVSVTFDKREALCILMQYEIELMYTFGTIAFKFICILRILHECSCLLHLFNELRKRDKMRGLPNFLSLFCNEFNKFNNTGARMLASIYHMTFSIL